MPSRASAISVILEPSWRSQVRYAFTEHSGFYREFYSVDAPVDPANNLRSLEEFAQLPILTKDEIRAVEQEEHPPYGRFLCILAGCRYYRVHGTSGNHRPSHRVRHWARRLGPHSARPTPASSGAPASAPTTW